MQRLILILLLFLTSCAQLLKGAEQPVMPYRDANTYRTTCSGMAEHWGACASKANRTCSKGYEIVDKTADTNGVIREMIFSCK